MDLEEEDEEKKKQEYARAASGISTAENKVRFTI